MACLGSTIDNFSWICIGDFNLASISTKRCMIDIVNMLFLSVFYVSLLIHLIKKSPASGCYRKGCVHVVTAVCCTLLSIAYFIDGLWDLIAKISGFNQLNSSVCIVRGLVWISLAVSLFVQRSQWIKNLCSIWWVSSCTLVSALNVEILLKEHTFQVFGMVIWLVLILTVLCAFQNHGYFVPLKTSDTSLCEPLVVHEVKLKQTGLGHATILSRLTFSWMNALLSLGYSKPLALEDIPSLDSEDKADFSYQKFAHAWDSLLWERGMKNSRNLVLMSIARVYLKENIFIALCAFLRTICAVVSPLLVYAFVNYSSSIEEDLKQGMAILGCLIFAKVVELGMKIRSALMAAVYKKQLKLSVLGKRRHSTGEIVNYIAVDAYRMGEFPWWFHTLLFSALQLFLALGVLFGVVGLGALPGLVPFLICGFLNVPFAKILQKYRSEFMIAQDERLRSTSEILSSMKIIKLQSWEDNFKKLVESLRAKEFECLAKTQFTRAYGTFIYWMSPTIISSVIFMGCVLFQSAPLNAGTIFTVLAALRSMGEPVNLIPEALSVLIQAKVSFDRLNTFLLDDEIKSDDDIGRNSKLESCNNSVEIIAGNFSWDQESMPPTLRDVNFEIKWGQTLAVCGPVGAGKTSLLYAILGEIPKISGTVSAGGTLAYVSQTPWIQSGTIRDNILYGKPMDETRYKYIIKVCALDKDIDGFSHGDLTEIGQRGINMSGGQKQRIQLARAVYNDADIYLLDDPFSAVDAHTASILFNDCVRSALRRKTVIVVTHQVEFLSKVDKILVMEGGEITQIGGYEDLLTARTAFEQLLSAHREAITGLEISNENKREFENVDTIQPEDSHVFNLTKGGSDGDISSKGQLTQEEEKEIGDVGWKPFGDYIFFPKGSLLLCLSTLSQLAFVGFQTASTYWLALAIEIPEVTSSILIGVYAVTSFLSIVFVYLRSFFGAQLGLKASKAFFSAFTDAIFNAPMLFFDSTPVGRILTRASSDLSILDFDIPFTTIFVAAEIAELLTMIGIMVSVTWQVLIVAFLAMVASKYIQGYYQASAREIIRINGTTKAPLMNFTAETSLGVITIRAFNMTDRFFKNYLKLVDTDATMFFHSNAAIEWLVLRIEVLQNLTLFTAALLLVLLPKGYVAPGLVGLSLSYAFSLTATQVYLTRMFCNLSNYVISVERIKQFIHIPAEPSAIVEDNRPPSSWPYKGRIDLQSLEIRYHPNAPLVLKGISCTFKEGSRVGVVGRTGSGKTTLISALFRLVEPTRGDILIDGINTCSIGVKDLRMKLSIIPQEPTLFKGSIRTNLDPLGLYSDDEIWKALEKCQLKATISGLPNLLDTSVSDEGENWSVGQRQLLCLGRVLLKRNRILVLDEATASIDSATDSILQRVIRQEFSRCTVITVAHRIPSVIDSDMIMVLSYGKLVEYDKPSKLMDIDSSFSKLVAEYWSNCNRNLLPKD
ncbi:ABC transporter C family member 8-like isoform X2 [Abrus precatorius]|uniref:ABC-type xenobiotic transporter n=1 Tax=Abrus precatorius TaxID=3816 RepID=A0A8B8JYN1_ABRPR|nr:ABC transporter C family member 8-like isoform X2 [Abrus precatorius]